MNCARQSCRQPIQRCPDKKRMGSCWYFKCTGYVHIDGLHACKDFDGEATSELPSLPLAADPAGKPQGEVA